MSCKGYVIDIPHHIDVCGGLGTGESWPLATLKYWLKSWGAITFS